MKSQKKLIHNTEWDYLLILDACRYDLFEKKFENYFDGDLSAARSEGSNTVEWITKTFPSHYDITYIAGNAFINSRGVKGLFIAEYSNQYPDYLATDHFERIIDTWEWGYDKEKETVLPSAVNQDLRRYHDDKVLAHYIQPHFPWARGDQEIETERERRKGFQGKVSDPRFSRIFLYEKFGENKVREAYIDNLELVLEGVSRVLKDLKGRIIISADHGEFLSGSRSHPPCRDDPELRIVPWCEIK